MKKFLVSLVAAAAVLAPAGVAQAAPSPVHHATAHYSYNQAWGHSTHLRHDYRRATVAEIYITKNFWIGATFVKARDYTLALRGPNLPVTPVQYTLYRDGRYVTSGTTVGGWTSTYVNTHGTSRHRYTYRFSGNRTVQPTTVSLFQ